MVDTRLLFSGRFTVGNGKSKTPPTTGEYSLTYTEQCSVATGQGMQPACIVSLKLRSIIKETR